MGWRKLHLGLMAGLAACSFDSSGKSQVSGVVSSTTAASDTNDDGPASTGGLESSGGAGVSATQGSSSGDAPDDSTAADPDTSGDPTPGGSSTTEPTDPCADHPPQSVTLMADQATLAGDMMLASLYDGTTYVYAETAGMGTATFAFDLQCADDFAVWMLVFDREPGLDTALVPGNPADSAHVDVTGAATDWRYGCQNLGAPPWSWQAVSENGDNCISNDRITFALPAGSNTITVSMLEGGTWSGNTISPGDVAAVKQILVTNDLDFEP
ncbi:MAG: hypothetical protein IPK74_01620 [Deltaproteobacteria bacterium]|nr:hypothetical protein [Deltaproteobacteria bacterium]